MRSDIRSVTAEVASSSLVVPAILFKRVVPISLEPLRTQKGTFLCLFLCAFWPSFSRSADSAPMSAGDGYCQLPFASCENTKDKTAA
jgi:hypothetical protein